MVGLGRFLRCESAARKGGRLMIGLILISAQQMDYKGREIDRIIDSIFI